MSKNYPLNCLKYPEHGESMATALASNLRHSSFADVKIICADGSAWAHRLVLAAVSPVLRHLLLSVEQDDVATIYLPQLSKYHLSLVLDYVYRGRMYIKANQLQHVLGVIEVLNLECGVSVSKKVRKEDISWVEEGVFTSFTDKGLLEEVRKSLKQEHYEPLSTIDDLEEAIEVKPEILQRIENPHRSLRNSIVDDDTNDYAVVEVECDDSDSDADNGDSSSDGQQPGQHGSQHKCIMCSKVFMHAENLRTHIQSHLGAKAQLRSCQRCRKNFRTAIEHDLHMLSHSYVAHLRKVKQDSSSMLTNSSNNKNRACLKKARYLVRTSIKRLLPKKTLKKETTTVEHQNDNPSVTIPIPLSQTKKAAAPLAKKTKKSPVSKTHKVKKSITKKQNKQHQKRRKRLQTPKKKKKELLKSTLCVNGGGRTTLKLSPTKDVFKASELDKNPLWQSCKLKIKIPISPLKVPRDSLPPMPTSSQHLKGQKSKTKGRKNKEATGAASTSHHSGSSPTKPKAKKGRKRKASSLAASSSSSSLHDNDGYIKAKKIKRPSLSETAASSPGAGMVSSSPGAQSPSLYTPPLPPLYSRKQSVEESLTCPTCDKVFIAKSILERHLKKSKHGMFEKDKDVMSPPPIVSLALDKAMAEGKQLPHLNQITQPKIEVCGREINKYECHLCKQVFLRVKDLAKHRERMMCAAWLNK